MRRPSTHLPVLMFSTVCICMPATVHESVCMYGDGGGGGGGGGGVRACVCVCARARD